MMEIEFAVEAFICDDYTVGTSSAVAILNKKDIKRIIRLSKEVKRLKVAKITEWDEPTWYASSIDAKPEERLDSDNCMDTSERIIDDSSFFYRANINHTNIEVYTDSISIENLKESLFVMEMPRVELPLHLHDLKTDQAKGLLQKRLKEKEEKID